MKHNQLDQIPNPLSDLMVIRRDLLAATFTSARDERFLFKAQQEGLQAAFSGTSGKDRERRIRMLSDLQPSWWNSSEHWKGFCTMLHPDAVSALMDEDA